MAQQQRYQGNQQQNTQQQQSQELVKLTASMPEILGPEMTAEISTKWTPAQVDSIRDMVLQGFRNRPPAPHEIAQFFFTAHRRGLDPFAKEIYGFPSWDSRLGRETLTTVVAIDAFRRIADETNTYAPGREKLIYDDNGLLVAAKVSCKKFVQGTWIEFWCRADFAEYAKTGKDGKVFGNWLRLPTAMLLKCAEARALRKGWPQQLKGLYTPEEMDQARNDEPKAQQQAPAVHQAAEAKALPSTARAAQRWDAAFAGAAPAAAGNVQQQEEPPTPTDADAPGEEPAEPTPKQPRRSVVLAEVPEDAEQLPADVAQSSRYFAQFVGKPFARMQERELAALRQVIDAVMEKTKTPSNRVNLGVLAAIVTNEMHLRTGANQAANPS